MHFRVISHSSPLRITGVGSLTEAQHWAEVLNTNDGNGAAAVQVWLLQAKGRGVWVDYQFFIELFLNIRRGATPSLSA